MNLLIEKDFNTDFDMNMIFYFYGTIFLYLFRLEIMKKRFKTNLIILINNL